MRKLKPCPFCGGELACFEEHDDGSVSVTCDSCNMIAGHYRSYREASYVFNSRAENSDFLPCPLCGEKADVMKPMWADGGWYVQCRTCYMDITSFVSRDDLKEKWNRRSR